MFFAVDEKVLFCHETQPVHHIERRESRTIVRNSTQHNLRKSRLRYALLLVIAHPQLCGVLSPLPSTS